MLKKLVNKFVHKIFPPRPFYILDIEGSPVSGYKITLGIKDSILEKFHKDLPVTSILGEPLHWSWGGGWEYPLRQGYRYRYIYISYETTALEEIAKLKNELDKIMDSLENTYQNTLINS